MLDGADGLLLGLETLEGQFPLKCIETALAIAREADAVYDYESRYKRQMQYINSKLALSLGSTSNRLSLQTRKEALSAAAVQTAFQIDATLIVVFSHTGETTRLVAKYHPACPVLSLSIPTVRGGTVKWTVEGDAEARHQLVYRGVVPALSAPVDARATEETPRDAVHDAASPGASRTDVEALTKAASLGLIAPGELAVFCQLIAGLSTVKVVQFGGGAETEPGRAASPAPGRGAPPTRAPAPGGRVREGARLEPPPRARRHGAGPRGGSRRASPRPPGWKVLAGAAVHRGGRPRSADEAAARRLEARRQEPSLRRDAKRRMTDRFAQYG